jgi:hypothetical protein
MARPRKTQKELKIARAWKDFYEGSGRIALAELFETFHVYSPIVATDPVSIATANGERNAVLHIARLIGLKAERFPTEAWDDHDILDRMLQSTE